MAVGYEVIDVEEAFIVEMVEDFEYTQHEAEQLWSEHGPKIINEMWDAYSTYVVNEIDIKSDSLDEDSMDDIDDY